MKQRIITGIVAVALFIPVLIFSNTIVFPIAFGLLALVAIGEMYFCVGLKKHPALIAMAFLVTGGSMAIAWHYVSEIEFSMILTRLFFVLVFMTLTSAVLSKGKLPITDVAVALVMVFYITYGFSSILLLRQAPNGAYIYLLVFLSAWLTDTGAYFTGVFFGKHKLIPDVSPKKTVEGAIGGIVTCVLTFIVYGFIVSKIGGPAPHYLWLAIAGVLVSIASMIGDLIASLVKRKYDIKDYGKLFPGHGGVLDRFDSVLATAPILWILVDYLPLFG